MSEFKGTKEEAIKAMKNGFKVTHKWFADNEWMTIKNGKIVLEDGIELDFYEFWNSRFQDGWKDGYSIIKEATNYEKA